jgi:Putative beta-barrel porin-2, OmpL-like. bbp2
VRLAAVLALLPSLALADDEPAPAPKLTLNGYIESFYQLNTNRPSNLVTAYRSFDDRTNSFTIENAVLDSNAQLNDVSVRIALQIGHAPSSYYGAEPTYPAGAGIGASDPELWRIIQQAIIGYKVHVGRGLLAEAGIFLSPIGLENLPIKDQWNWSRSDLFTANPLYHSGVRVTYPFTDELTAVFYITNGWNDIVNRNPYPCFAASGTYTPSPALAINAVYFGGVEDPSGAPEGQPWRNLFDVNAVWSPTAWLSLAAEADTGFEPNHFGTSHWLAGAAYVRVQPVKKLFLVGRYDRFDEHDAVDADGAASRLFFPVDTVSSETATADFRPASNLSLRLEFRHDHASAPMFFRGEVPQVAGSDIPTARAQDTFTLGAVAWF